MKILILVLSTDSYHQLTNCQKATWGSKKVENVRVVYYYGRPVKNNTTEDYYFDIREDHDTIGIKTLKAFEYFLKEDFDYLFRVNSSSYVDQEKVLKWLEDKPKAEFYAGVSMNYGIEFMHGSGYILSKDLVQLIVTQKTSMDTSIADDVSIGKLLSENKIPFYNKFRHCIIQYYEEGVYDLWNTNEGDTIIYYKLSDFSTEHLHNSFHFRCKYIPDRSIDCKIMSKLHNLIDNE